MLNFEYFIFNSRWEWGESYRAETCFGNEARRRQFNYLKRAQFFFYRRAVDFTVEGCKNRSSVRLCCSRSKKITLLGNKIFHDAIQSDDTEKTSLLTFYFISTDCDLFFPLSHSHPPLILHHFIWLRWISLLGYLMRFQQCREKKESRLKEWISCADF